MGKNSTINERELLKKFNNRDAVAIGDIYSMLNMELNTYAAVLYRDFHIHAEDVVHDAFINLWTNNEKFTSLKGVKSYLIVSIKNGFKNYIAHNVHVDKYKSRIISENSYDINYIESELICSSDEILSLLPEKYAKVLRLYIDGWKSGEIATELGYSEQTVYNIKNKSINILRKKNINLSLIFTLLKGL